MAEVDSLIITIDGEAKTAASGIDAMVSVLDRIRTSAKGGAGLSSVSKQLQAIAAANNAINNSGFGKIKELGDSINSLNGVKVSSSIATQLNKLSAALNSVKGTDGAKIKALADGLRPLSDLGRSQLTSFINQLGKLPKVISDLDSADLEKFTAQIRQLTSAISPLASEANKMSKAFSSIPNTINKVVKGNVAISSSSVNTSKAIHSFGGSLGWLTAKAGAMFLVFKKIASVLADFVTSINQYIESANLFSVSMGEFYDEAYDYAMLVNEKLGIDPAAWMDAQGSFMLMAKGFGIAEKQAFQLSEGLTELAYDISSLQNLQPEEAITKLRSALAGELEPIRALGLSISQATLQEYALSKGIKEAVTAMTEQEKALLRSVKVLEDSARIGYMGDFVKTIESPANALRILKQQITEMGRAIGSVLLPPLMYILPFLRAFVSLVTQAVKAFAALVGFEMPEWDSKKSIAEGAAATEEGFEGAADAAKELKNAVLGIDELNVISPPESSGAGSDGMSDWANGLEIPEFWDKNIISQIETKASQLEGKIKDFVKRLMEPFNSLDFSNAFNRVKEFVGNVKEQIKTANDTDEEGGFSDTLLGLWDNAVETVGKIVNLGTQTTLPIIEALNIPQITLDALQTASTAIQTVGSIAESITPGLTNFVNLGLVPIAGWLGGKISEGLTFASEQMNKIGTWFEEHTPDFSTLGENLGTLVGNIWAFLEPFASEVWKGILTTLSGVVDVLLSLGDEIVDLAKIVSEDLIEAWGKFEEIITPVADFIKTAIADVFNKIINPTLSYLADTIIPTLSDGFKNLWEQVLVPLWSFLASVFGPILQIVGKLLAWMWEYAVVPLANTVGGVFSTAFENIAKIWNERVIPGVSKIIQALSWLWTNVLEPIVGFLWNTFGPAFEWVFKFIEKIIANCKLVFEGLINFVTGVFTWDWEQAWQGIKDIFVGIFGTLARIALEPINGVIGYIESLVNKVIQGANFLLGIANNLGADFEMIGTIMIDRLEYHNLGLDTPDYYNSPNARARTRERQQEMANKPAIEVDEAALKDAALRELEGYGAALEMEEFEMAFTNSLFSQDFFSVGSQKGTAFVEGFDSVLKDAALRELEGYGAALEMEEFMKEPINFQGVSDDFSKQIDEMKSTNSSFAQESSDSISETKKEFNTALEEGTIAVKSATDSMSKMFRTMSNNSISAINGIISRLNSIPRSITTVHTIITSHEDGGGSSGISAFASGGFPDHGQLFLAREAGPELVGTIGGQTAVANNAQIVDGIRQGVAEAEQAQNALLREQNDLLLAILQKTGTVHITNKQIKSAYDKATRESGARIISGGVFA